MNTDEGLTQLQWRRRHRLILLAVPVLLIPTVSALAQQTLSTDLAATYLLVTVMQAMLALSARSSGPVRQLFAASSLLTAAATLVATTGRDPASHLVFIVVACVVTLYQDWVVWVGTLAYIAFYFLVLGTLDPTIVHADGQSGAAWAAVIVAATTAASSVSMLSWALSRRTVRERAELGVALAESALRERQARDLNDTVIQHLATAVYAADAGDTDQVRAAAGDALDAARKLIGGLDGGAWLDDPILRRDDASQNPELP